MLFNKYQTVLDLGSRYLKTVRAKQLDKLKYQVSSYNMVEAPSEQVFSTVPAETVEIPQNFGRSLNQLIQDSGCAKENVLLLLPDYGFLVNMAAIPSKAVEEEKHELAKQEIGTLLPPDTSADLWCIEKRNIGDLHANSLVLLAAVLRANVLAIGTEVQNRGPNPIVVDMGILNAVNVFHDYLVSSENLEKNIGILNFGHRASSLAIFKQGKLTTVHTRSIGNDGAMLVGGRAFTDKIREHFKLGEDEAEDYKKNEVFFLPEFVPEQDKIANYQVIKPVFGELVRGVFTITEHYVARFREFKVDEVIITGGGANFSNIDIVLGGHLNTQVKQGADIVSIVDSEMNELSADEKNILTPAIGAFCRN